MKNRTSSIDPYLPDLIVMILSSIFVGFIIMHVLNVRHVIILRCWVVIVFILSNTLSILSVLSIRRICGHRRISRNKVLITSRESWQESAWQKSIREMLLRYETLSTLHIQDTLSTVGELVPMSEIDSFLRELCKSGYAIHKVARIKNTYYIPDEVTHLYRATERLATEQSWDRAYITYQHHP